MEKRSIRETVLFVEDPDDRFVVDMKLTQNAFHGLNLFFESGVGNVDDVKEDVRFLKLAQGRLEGGQQVLGQVSDEADRVGDDRLGIPRKAQAGTFGIEGGKEKVLRQNAAFRQRIQERRFARIGVADN